MDYFAAMNAFVEVARQGSFSRAAERLGIKASTISRYVRDLEADLGIALFNRSTRALKLTEGGNIFLMHSVVVLENLESARSATSALNDQPRGVLRLSVPSAFARYHIVPFMQDFKARYPEIEVDLSCVDNSLNLIESGTDLAIRFGCLPDSSLKARKIADEQWILCGSPSLASKFESGGDPDAFEEAPFISARGRVEVQWRHGDRAFRRAYPVQLRIDDMEAQMSAAEASLGIALLPGWLAAQSIAQDRLARLLEGWECTLGGDADALWFVYPPKRIVSSKVRSFIDYMVERIGAPPYWRL